MLPNQESIADVLRHHRHLRDFGVIVLLVGVILETVIDPMWEWLEPAHPPLLRGARATTLLKRKSTGIKVCVKLFIGIALVGGGVALEWIQGNRADDISHYM